MFILRTRPSCINFDPPSCNLKNLPDEEIEDPSFGWVRYYKIGGPWSDYKTGGRRPTYSLKSKETCGYSRNGQIQENALFLQNR